MYRHLVTIEVRIKRGTNKGMKLNSLTFYKDRLKCLDTKTVQCRRTVQHNRMFFDNVLENVPYLRLELLHHFLCIFNVVRGTVCNKLFHNKRLEQLDSHLFRKTALINLQLRSYDDNRTSGVVNSFTQKVLTETSGFTFQHIGKGFQSSVSRTGNRASAASVVNKSIYCFLQHTFLVADDNIRSAKLQQSFQTIVSVDDSSVQVVQVRCCKTSAVKLYHRTKIRRDNRNCCHDHPLRTVAGLTEGFHNLQTFDDSGTFLSCCIHKLCLQLLSILFQINGLQKLHYRLCAHSYTEAVSIGLTGILVFLFCKDLFVLKPGISRVQYDIVCEI